MPSLVAAETLPAKQPSRDDASWYAVYTKHHHEKSACQSLSGKGIEVFLPLYHDIHSWTDRMKKVELPLFPCYLFVKSNLDRRSDILRSPGVFSLVESAGRPCEIPDFEIDALRRATSGQAPVEPHSYLKCGDRVRVKEGALAGLEGILSRIKSRCRVVLSVDLLQKSVAVEVDAALLETLGPAAPPLQLLHTGIHLLSKNQNVVLVSLV